MLLAEIQVVEIEIKIVAVVGEWCLAAGQQSAGVVVKVELQVSVVADLRGRVGLARGVVHHVVDLLAVELVVVRAVVVVALLLLLEQVVDAELAPVGCSVGGCSGRGRSRLLRHQLEALPAPQVAAILEHFRRIRVQSPIGALAGPIGAARNLDETIVEGQIVAQTVLPALRVLPIEGKSVHDELVDLTECQHFLFARLDGHKR